MVKSLEDAAETWLRSWCALQLTDVLFFGFFAYWRSPGIHIIEMSLVAVMVLALFIKGSNFLVVVVSSALIWVVHYPDVTAHSTVMFVVNVILLASWRSTLSIYNILSVAKPTARVAYGLFWVGTAVSKMNYSFLRTDGQSCGTLLPVLMLKEFLPDSVASYLIPALKEFGPLVVIITELSSATLYLIYPDLGEIAIGIVQGAFLFLKMPVGVTIFSWIGWEIIALGNLQSLSIMKQRLPNRWKQYLPYWFLFLAPISAISNHLSALTGVLAFSFYLFFRITAGNSGPQLKHHLNYPIIFIVGLLWSTPYLGIGSLGPGMFANLRISCHESNHLFMPPMCLTQVQLPEVEVIGGNHSYVIQDAVCSAPFSQTEAVFLQNGGLPSSLWIHGYLSQNNHLCGFEKCNFRLFTISTFELARGLSYRHGTQSWNVIISDNGTEKMISFDKSKNLSCIVMTDGSRCSVSKYSRIQPLHKLIKIRHRPGQNQELCMD